MQAARTAFLFSRLQKTLELKEKGQKGIFLIIRVTVSLTK